MNVEDLKIVIADDNLSSRTLLRRFLETFHNISIIAEAENGDDLVQTVIMEEPHLVLVDVSMPILNGIEAVKECLKQLPQLKVIFITGHDDYAVEAFNLSAVDYIVKPVERMRLFHGVEKARQAVKARNEQLLKEFSGMKDILIRLVIRSDKAIHFIPLQDIVFIEKTARKAFVHTRHKIFEINETLGALLKRLDHCFLLTHRSFIINFSHIASIVPSGDSNLVYFHNYDKTAYISKLKLNEVLELLEKA
jgi:two-component system LytT family response regulator